MQVWIPYSAAQRALQMIGDKQVAEAMLELLVALSPQIEVATLDEDSDIIAMLQCAVLEDEMAA